jgi:uncharacterized protein
MMMRFFRSPSLFVITAFVLLSLNLLTPSSPVEAAIPGLAGGYSQNFDTLANSGTGNSWVNEELGTATLPGWRIVNHQANPPSSYRTSNSNVVAAIYSYGSDTSTERALGSLASNSIPLWYYGVELTNNTGALVTSVTISYRGEQWVIGSSNTDPDTLVFEYEINASGINTTGWTRVTALDFVSPQVMTPRAPNDGNAAGSYTNLSATINLSLQADDSLWLRWMDVDDGESDHGLAIDNLVVTVNGNTPASSTPTPVTPTNTPTPVTGTPVSPTPTASPVTPTSGPSPTNTPQVACSAPDRIYELQEGGAKYNPSATPSAARTVAGIVVGDFQTGLDGFYLQDETGDGNPATSDGIFVYDPAPLLLDVTIGQRVIVTGSTLEFKSGNEPLSETEIIAQSVTACGTGTATITPATITLPISNLSLYENYEGMLVNIVSAAAGQLTVSETFTLARFGEVVVSSDGRLFQPTNYTAPGSSAIAAQELNNRRRLLIDDGQNGTPANGAVPYIPTTETEFRLGFTTPNITGILEYGFNSYRLQPTVPIVWSAVNPRPLTPPVVEGSDVRVATMNLLNFFNGDGAGGGFPTSRGADTPAEFARQKIKTVAAIVGLNADILVMNELEDDNTATQYAAVEELVDGVNTVVGVNTYTFIDTGVIGTDEIRVGVLYRSGNVQPVGNFALLTTPPFNEYRPSLAQLFEHVATGERFYVIANHFKSKGCDDATGADQDQNDGQSCFNATRVQMSQLLVTWVTTDPYFAGDPDVLIMGDLNSYAMENPITTLKSLGFTNLVEAFTPSGEIAYSYVFGGQSGTLDYAFANNALLPQIVGAADWHISADEPIGRDYNDDLTTSGEFNEYRQPYLYQPNGFRVSDHDPLVVSIRFDGAIETSTPITQTSTPVLTSTPLPGSDTPDPEATVTSTPEPTMTATVTLQPAIDLIVNGGFEAKNNTSEAAFFPWKLKNDSNDKIICDKTPTIAFAGECAFRFKGSLFENAKLSQEVDLTTFSAKVGDSLRFGIYYSLPKEASKLKVKAAVKYADLQQLPGLVKQTLTQTAGYQQFTGDIVLSSTALNSIKVTISNKSEKGKAYIDAVRLELDPAVPVLALP